MRQLAPLAIILALCGCDLGGGDALVSGTFADTEATLDAAKDALDVGLDVAPDVITGGCPGGANCACLTSTDCADGLCLPSPDGKRCAPACDSPCGSGASCQIIGAGAAAKRFCVPTWGLLCRPCKSNAECQVAGVTNTACVSHGDAGGYCGAGCSSSASCPTGYQCDKVNDVLGALVKQCVPTGGGPARNAGLADCACSPYARTRLLGTTCWVGDSAASAQKRRCKGQRYCDETGLSACIKFKGAGAQCVDEVCADQPDKTPCDDGEACTIGDTCVGQQCVAGDLKCECTSSADCASKEDGDLCTGTLYCDKSGAKPKCAVNPATVVHCSNAKDTACTKNVCAPSSGTCALKHNPSGTLCTDGDPCTNNDTCDGKGACEGLTETCKCTSDADCGKHEDGDACNGTLYCEKSSGKCKLNPATIVTCPSVGDTVCAKNQCDSKTGKCTATATKDGVACDDANVCTTGDVCSAGLCKSGQFTCPCKDDKDCAAKENGTVCDGTLFCDQTVGKCKHNPATVIVCPDADDTTCVVNTCHPKTGVCAPTPVAGDNVICADGNPCTTGEVCKKGQCTSSANICDCQKDGDCASKEDGDLCNGTLFCNVATGKCQSNPATPVVCPSVDDNLCSQNLCQPKTGKCLMTASKDGKWCDADGSACTQNDGCKAGVCTAGTQTCECESDADCSGKDDGNACNGSLYCDKSGKKPKCSVNPATVISCDTKTDSQCTKTVCQPKSGQCLKAALPDGAPCQDGDACTQGDSCGKGQCVSGKDACPCKLLGDCSKFITPGPCVKAACDPKVGGCVALNVDKACDDGNACTSGDVCKNAACQPGQAVNCDDKNPCTNDVCDKSKGCQSTTHTKPCSDGDACTAGDACKAGACAPGSAVTCNDNKVCTTDACDKAKGCVFVANTMTCDDGSACTKSDQCKGGVCVGTGTCNDGNPCTDDVCDKAKGCQSTPHTKGCSDGNACTSSDACKAGKCEPGSPTTCNDNNACTDDTCDKAKGCVFSANTKVCDDKDACTTGDKCAKGVCAASPKSCDDGNPCTTDKCDKTNGCEWASNTAPCSYSDACQSPGVCAKGKCTAGQTKSCNDGNGCTTDSCDSKLGCVNTPNNGACDDANKCTTDTCDKTKGCVATKQTGAPCDDGKACTSGDKCTDGVCAGTANGCDDGNECTNDSCDAGGKCVHQPNFKPCEDPKGGNLCFDQFQCQGGVCQGQAPKVCGDGNACTKDSCLEAIGQCEFEPLDGSGCNDGDACTLTDTCKGTKCTGGPLKKCDDNNICTSDTCDSKKGCVYADNTLSCSDGNACTIGDKCGQKLCKPGTAKNCDDGDKTTVDTCIKSTGNCQNLKPGVEICDNKDNDNDGFTDEGCDDDGDGYCDSLLDYAGTPAVCPKGKGDCDDTTGWINPGRKEICGDGVDNDCKAGKDDGCDVDGDGYCGEAVLVVPGKSCGKNAPLPRLCSSVYRTNLAPAAKPNFAVGKAGVSGGYQPYYDELWSVEDAAGKVRTLHVASNVVDALQTGVAGLHSLVGEPHAAIWYGTIPGTPTKAGTDPKGAVVKVGGKTTKIWRATGIGTYLHGVAILGRHVVVTSAGELKPALYRISRSSGRLHSKVQLTRTSGSGAFTAGIGLAAIGDRVWLPDSTAVGAVRAYAATDWKSIGAQLSGNTAVKLMFGYRGHVCTLRGSATKFTCVQVADYECKGTDCNDKEDKIAPLKPEILTDKLDNDCDGVTDAPQDSDSDGVCVGSALCPVQRRDSCPGVWNPTNDPSQCEAVAPGYTHQLELKMTPPDMTVPRAHELVEVPLANGIANAEVFGHWWFIDGKIQSTTALVAKTGQNFTPTAGPFGTFNSGVTLPKTVGLTVNQDGGEFLTEMSTLTIGGWFRVGANIGTAALIQVEHGVTATLGLVGSGQNRGKPVVSVATGGGTVQVSDPKALTAGWHHVAAVMSPKMVLLYRDGKLIGSKAVSKGYTPTSNAVRTVAIGGYDTTKNGTTNNQHYGHEVGEVLIHRRAMTPAEVQAWASSKAIYGSRLTGAAAQSYEDVRLVETTDLSTNHVPHQIIGARSMTAAQVQDATAVWRLNGAVVEAKTGTKGTSTSSTRVVMGRYGDQGGAMRFGKSAEGTANSSMSFNLDTTGATIQTWARLPVDSTDQQGTLWVTRGTGQSLSLTLKAGKVALAGASTKGPISSPSSGVLPRGVWVHVAAVIQGFSATLYIDGIKVGTDPGPGGTLVLDKGQCFGNATVNGGESLEIELDEVAVIGRALSADEVRNRALGLPRVQFLSSTTLNKVSGTTKYQFRDYRLMWGGDHVPRPPQPLGIGSAGLLKKCNGVLTECQGARAMWTFNHSNGDVAVDLTSWARHGTFSGAGIVYVPGPTGAAFAPATEGQVVQVDPSVFHDMGAFAIELFMSGVMSPGQWAVHVGTATNSPFNVTTGDPLLLFAYSANFNGVTLPLALPVASELFDLFTLHYNSSTLDAYHNGFLFGSGKSATGNLNVTAGMKASIGNRFDAPKNGGFGGGISTVRVSSRALAKPEFMHQVPAVAAPHWAAGDYPVIPGGRYVRGCSAANYKSCAAAEGPPTLTWLSQFGLSYSEITVSKYKDCVTAKSCTTPADISGGTYKAGGPTMPVNAVTWQQCRDYCRWAGGDLPTEAQWARAGSVPCAPNATDVACLKIAPQLYPWGNDAPTCTKANATLAGKVCTNGPRDTQLLPATSSVTGHEGLAGNLSEWVLDAYSTTALKDLSPYDPYLADPANSNRGVRGGSWLSAPKDLRTHQRLYFGTPTLFRQQYGCRCAIR